MVDLFDQELPEQVFFRNIFFGSKLIFEPAEILADHESEHAKTHTVEKAYSRPTRYSKLNLCDSGDDLPWRASAGSATRFCVKFYCGGRPNVLGRIGIEKPSYSLIARGDTVSAFQRRLIVISVFLRTFRERN